MTTSDVGGFPAGGRSLIALAANIIGIVFACVPGALVVGWILLLVAFVLGIAGVCQFGK